MMRSMYSGVSGLRMHQTKMDAIGNNIANVNTVGFKRSSVQFKEIFSQLVRGAGAPQGGLGGTNAQQIGLGGSVGAISVVHTNGGTQRTDNPTDLMIDGDGFFMVSDDPNYENVYYTRAGNFDLDRDGFLVTPDGYHVLGLDKEGNIAPMRVNKSETVAPTTSKFIEFQGNIDSRLPDFIDRETGLNIDTDTGIPSGVAKGRYTTDVTVKDSLGNSYKVNFNFDHLSEESNPFMKAGFDTMGFIKAAITAQSTATAYQTVKDAVTSAADTLSTFYTNSKNAYDAFVKTTAEKTLANFYAHLTGVPVTPPAGIDLAAMKTAIDGLEENKPEDLLKVIENIADFGKAAKNMADKNADYGSLLSSVDNAFSYYSDGAAAPGPNAKSFSKAGWTMNIKNVVNLSTNEPLSFDKFTTKIENPLNFNKYGELLSNGKFEISFGDPTDPNYTMPGHFGQDATLSGNKIQVDFSKLTQYANESDGVAKDTPITENADIGASSGRLNGFSIDASGILRGSFTNGVKKDLGQLMLAKFDNTSGLEKIGNNFFTETSNSGQAQKGKAGTGGLGQIKPGSLEMSNVDLSMEFTDMITTQRGFQANSRVITTTDEMLQELVNLKR